MKTTITKTKCTIVREELKTICTVDICIHSTTMTVPLE